MRVQLDASVRTKDGQRAGHVKRVIFDPERNEVTAFVLNTGGFLGHDVIVSPDVLERGANADEIVVDLTKDELNGLEHYEETAYAPPPAGWIVPAPYTYPTASFLFPSEPGVPLPPADPGAGRSRRPAISEGMKVTDATGAVIGVVKELRVDDMTGELRSIVVRDEGPLGGDDEAMEIAADHVDVGDREIHIVEQSGPTHAGGREGA